MITEDDKHQFVAMDHCSICGEVTGIAMQTRFTKDGRPLHEMPKDVCTSLTPCDKCKEKAKELDGVWCYEGGHEGRRPEPTGRIVMLSRESVQRVFNEDVIKTADEFGYLMLEPELFSLFMNTSEANNAGERERR